MNLGNDKALWLLFLIPAVLLPAYLWCFYKKASALKVLASIEMLRQINASVSLKRQVLKSSLVMCAFAAIVISLTQPRWNARPLEIKSSGRDVVILLDTSRSMLAEDIKPSRLERAKIAIGDLVEQLAGDRIAIVTFAGNSAVKCPLTQDYAFVRMAIADISTESSARGGTAIGDAIRKATEEVFDRQSREYKDLILITDGEDHDSFPVEAAQKAAAEGIRIIAVGLGDEHEGSRIPITGPDGRQMFLKYQGQEVWTKLDADTLRRVAAATKDGKYIGVEPGTTLDLGEIYSQLVASAEKREFESTTMIAYDERFQIFIAIGIVFLICEVLISERRKDKS